MKKILVPSTGEIIAGCCYLAFQLTLLPAFLSLAGAAFSLSAAWQNVLYFAVNCAGAIAIFLPYLRRSVYNGLQAPGRTFGFAAIGFALYWAANFLLAQLLQALELAVNNANDRAIRQLLAQAPIPMGIATALLAPIAEEVFFRGMLFSGLRPKSRTAAYGLSMAGFCMLHLLPWLTQADPRLLVICFIQYLPAGFFLAWACERTNSILTPILIHAAANLISICAMR